MTLLRTNPHHAPLANTRSRVRLRTWTANTSDICHSSHLRKYASDALHIRLWTWTKFFSPDFTGHMFTAQIKSGFYALFLRRLVSLTCFSSSCRASTSCAARRGRTETNAASCLVWWGMYHTLSFRTVQNNDGGQVPGSHLGIIEVNVVSQERSPFSIFYSAFLLSIVSLESCLFSLIITSRGSEEGGGLSRHAQSLHLYTGQ